MAEWEVFITLLDWLLTCERCGGHMAELVMHNSCCGLYYVLTWLVVFYWLWQAEVW